MAFIDTGILKKPLLTEKYSALTEKLGQYAFIVEKAATKPEIRAAIELIYGVQVDEVRTMIYAGDRKQRSTKRGFISGKTISFKKAVVTLAQGQAIDFYANI